MLPPSLFANISGRHGVGVFFAQYRETTLLPIREIGSRANAETDVNTVVGSSIASVSVGTGLIFRDLVTPIQINLVIPDMNSSVSRNSMFYFIFRSDLVSQELSSLFDLFTLNSYAKEFAEWLKYIYFNNTQCEQLRY